jgi:hypothetical protein
MKKIMIVFASLLMMTSAFATPVEGEIFYTLPNGNAAVRNVTLEVPSRGQGEVKLFNSNFEWTSTNFRSAKVGDQTLFMVVFDTEFRGKKAKILLKGTYFKTKDVIKYYGSMYKGKKKKMKYIGGFNFNYAR